jgi:hypothetical protein
MSIRLHYHLILLLSVIKKLAITLINAALLIVYSLLFLTSAVASTQDDYFDDMITLEVGRHLTLEFYEVKSGFDGGIYLDLVCR